MRRVGPLCAEPGAAGQRAPGPGGGRRICDVHGGRLSSPRRAARGARGARQAAARCAQGRGGSLQASLDLEVPPAAQQSEPPALGAAVCVGGGRERSSFEVPGGDLSATLPCAPPLCRLTARTAPPDPRCRRGTRACRRPCACAASPPWRSATLRHRPPAPALTRGREKCQAAMDVFFPPSINSGSAREVAKSRLRMVLVADRCIMSQDGIAGMKVRRAREARRSPE